LIPTLLPGVDEVFTEFPNGPENGTKKFLKLLLSPEFITFAPQAGDNRQFDAQL